MLLTQGWTGYTLNEILEAINPIEKYRFETGFELKGSVKDEKRHKNLVLIPDNLRITDKVALKGRSEFVFQNLNVFKRDTIRVAFRNWLGKIIKPAKIVYDPMLRDKVSKLSVNTALNIPKTENVATNGFDDTKTYGSNDWNDASPPRNSDETINLDEVIVTEKKRSEKYVARRKLIKKYEPLVRNIGQYYNLPASKVSSNYDISLLDFLALQRFQLWTNDNVRYFLIDPATLKNKRGPRLGFLYIDGRPVAPEELRGVQLKKKDIDNIMVSNLNKPVAIFQVFTSDSYRKNTAVLFDKFIITNGFDSPKKYYTPLYVFERSRTANFLEVDWKPNIKTNAKGEMSFKMATKDNDNGLLFWIQGFSNEGHLISKTITTN